MHFIVGLGNPGNEYSNSRHNIGFLALDYLGARLGATLSSSRWKAETSKCIPWNQSKVILIKPLTFMNRSGEAVSAILSYYKGSPQNLIVIHDDLDLTFGRIKCTYNRGAGGHKGIQSIITAIDTKEFVRLRLGISHPGSVEMVSKYVLSPFSRNESASLLALFERIEEALCGIILRGIGYAMTTINSFDKIAAEDNNG